MDSGLSVQHIQINMYVKVVPKPTPQTCIHRPYRPSLWTHSSVNRTLFSLPHWVHCSPKIISSVPQSVRGTDDDKNKRQRKAIDPFWPEAPPPPPLLPSQKESTDKPTTIITFSEISQLKFRLTDPSSSSFSVPLPGQVLGNKNNKVVSLHPKEFESGKHFSYVRL